MALSLPLVSVICLCYNHERSVQAALASVCNQTYPNIEIIIVDDASTDTSVEKIRASLDQHTHRHAVRTLFLPKNVGNCKAFNQGLAYATGKYIVDFATDDIMLPNRLAQQIGYFERLPAQYGVLFTEAAYIDEGDNFLQFHYQGKLKHLQNIPTGDVYQHILQLYFVCGPTMLVKKEVFDRLGGYDENLAYEDFDFWVRSSRYFHYAFLNECTTQVRMHPASMSTKCYKPSDPQLHSTYVVCLKAARLNKTEEEKAALLKRIRFELRQAIFYNLEKEANLFFDLLEQQKGMTVVYKVLYFLFRVSSFVRITK